MCVVKGNGNSVYAHKYMYCETQPQIIETYKYIEIVVNESQDNAQILTDSPQPPLPVAFFTSYFKMLWNCALLVWYEEIKCYRDMDGRNISFTAGSRCTKWTDVLPEYFVKTRNHEIQA